MAPHNITDPIELSALRGLALKLVFFQAVCVSCRAARASLRAAHDIPGWGGFPHGKVALLARDIILVFPGREKWTRQWEIQE